MATLYVPNSRCLEDGENAWSRGSRGGFVDGGVAIGGFGSRFLSQRIPQQKEVIAQQEQVVAESVGLSLWDRRTLPPRKKCKTVKNHLYCGYRDKSESRRFMPFLPYGGV